MNFFAFILTNIVIEPKAIIHQWPLWLNLLLILLFTIYVWLRYAYAKRIAQILNAFFTSRAVNQLIREETARHNRLSFSLTIFSLLVISLFILEMILYFYTTPLLNNTFYLYLILFACIVLIYFLKLGIIKTLGIIFKKQSAAEEYVFNISIFNQSAGIFLLPVIISIAFIQIVSPVYFFYLGLLLMALAFLSRLFRSITGSGSGNFSKYYLFLYICTLEILPLVVFTKAFVGKI